MPDAFEVFLTKTAQEELDKFHDWWAENRSPEQANRWYSGFFQAMISLEQNSQQAQTCCRVSQAVDPRFRRLGSTLFESTNMFA